MRMKQGVATRMVLAPMIKKSSGGPVATIPEVAQAGMCTPTASTATTMEDRVGQASTDSKQVGSTECNEMTNFATVP